MVKSNIQIIAGKHRGKKLYMANKETTRSSKNILKESVFNTLQFEVVDAVFVEVFAGTGSVGLEALSRGSKFAYFLEKDRNSFRVLNENIKGCKEKENSEVILGDSFNTIWDVVDKLQRNKEKAFFYFDPPFAVREGNAEIYDKVVETIAKLPKINVEKIIIEYQTGIEFPEIIGKYKQIKTKKFGKSSIAYYE